MKSLTRIGLVAVLSAFVAASCASSKPKPDTREKAKQSFEDLEKEEGAKKERDKK